MSFKTSTFLVAALFAVLFAAPAAFAVNAGTNAVAEKPTDKITELFGDAVVAKGEGVEVKRSQLDSAIISIKSAAAARGQPMPPEQVRMLEQQVLQRLIQIQLLLSMATEADRTNGKQTAEKRLELILKRAGSEEALNRQLKSVGMTREELRTKMAEEAAAEAVLDRELKVSVTDEEVKKFYDDNPARFEEPEKVRASHVLLGTHDPDTRQPLSDEKKTAKRKQAEDVLKRARAGEDFAKLAREYSDDPGSKDKGGEYIFPRGMMDPAFESAAFSLNTNQVSDIVTTQFGYHIIKLSEKIPAHKVELAKVSDELKGGLKRREIEKLLPDYVEKLKADHHVEILDEKLKPKEAAPRAAAAEPETAGGKKAAGKK